MEFAERVAFGMLVGQRRLSVDAIAELCINVDITPADLNQILTGKLDDAEKVERVRKALGITKSAIKEHLRQFMRGALGLLC